MLILSRTVGEKIIIELNGEKVEVILHKVSGKHVQLGFVASRDVTIYREELANFSKRNGETGEPKEGNKPRDFKEEIKELMCLTEGLENDDMVTVDSDSVLFKYIGALHGNKAKMSVRMLKIKMEVVFDSNLCG